MSEQPQTALEGAELATVIEGYASDVKAIDVVELDLRGVLGYTDYFVICSGNTDRQTKAIHDRIHQGLKKEHGLLPRRVEGLGEARWILLDYTDFFLVCSGGTDRQTKAIHDRVHEGLKREHGLLPRRVEGTQQAN